MTGVDVISFLKRKDDAPEDKQRDERFVEEKTE